jgi:hypothetical protein
VLTREVPEDRARRLSVVDSDSEIAEGGKVTMWELFQHAKVPEVLASTEF